MDGVPKLPIGGVFTPLLAQAIVKYQQNPRQSNGRIVVDGIIDPLPSQSGTQGDWDTTSATVSEAPSPSFVIACSGLIGTSTRRSATT